MLNSAEVEIAHQEYDRDCFENVRPGLEGNKRLGRLKWGHKENEALQSMAPTLGLTDDCRPGLPFRRSQILLGCSSQTC